MQQGQCIPALAAALQVQTDATPEQLLSAEESLKQSISKSQADVHLCINFKSFEVGNLALFVPSANGIYKALNSEASFLDIDSLLSRTHELLSSTPFIVGEIISRRVYAAAENYNPFGLRSGTEFAVLSISEVEFSNAATYS